MDLHIHTNLSDGTKNAVQILDMAQELKLQYISITDHDTCDAYETIEKIDRYKHYTGNIITGCEILTCFDGVVIEILAYGMEWKPLNNWLKEYYSKEQIEKREKKIFNKLKHSLLNNSKIKISKSLSLPTKIPYSGYYKLMLYKDILKYEKNNSFLKKYDINTYEDFLRRGLYNKKSPIYINQEEVLINVKKVTELIHKLGGLAFVAHIYKLAINNHIEFLQKMLDQNVKIDGIEVSYSSFKKIQEEKLIEFCTEKNLYMSGGSDYHGDDKRTEQLGFGTEGKKISKKYIEEWYNKITKSKEKL